MFDVTFWGVRGSIGTAGPAFAGVGGHTSCVEVRAGGARIVLDAGTGLRGLGERMLREGAPDATVLLTHYHWDHIQGFPFFAPAYVPGARVRVVGPDPAGDGRGVRAALAGQMARPFFPVELDVFRAELAFAGLAAGGALELGDVRVVTAPAAHPGGCLAYRIEHGGRAVVLATDTEHEPGAPEVDPNLCALAAGADVLIYDAQYTPEEHARKRGWGHSTAEEGVRLADAAGVGRLVLFHHDPGHDDATIAWIEARAQAARANTIAAREGLVATVGEAPVRKAA